AYGLLGTSRWTRKLDALKGSADDVVARAARFVSLVGTLREDPAALEEEASRQLEEPLYWARQGALGGLQATGSPMPLLHQDLSNVQGPFDHWFERLAAIYTGQEHLALYWSDARLLDDPWFNRPSFVAVLWGKAAVPILERLLRLTDDVESAAELALDL